MNAEDICKSRTEMVSIRVFLSLTCHWDLSLENIVCRMKCVRTKNSKVMAMMPFVVAAMTAGSSRPSS